MIFLRRSEPSWTRKGGTRERKMNDAKGTTIDRTSTDKQGAPIGGVWSEGIGWWRKIRNLQKSRPNIGQCYRTGEKIHVQELTKGD